MRKEDRDAAMKAIEARKTENEVSPVTLAIFYMASSKH